MGSMTYTHLEMQQSSRCISDDTMYFYTVLFILPFFSILPPNTVGNEKGEKVVSWKTLESPYAISELLTDSVLGIHLAGNWTGTEITWYTLLLCIHMTTCNLYYLMTE